jgi:hypothetical protein
MSGLLEAEEHAYERTLLASIPDDLQRLSSDAEVTLTVYDHVVEDWRNAHFAKRILQLSDEARARALPLVVVLGSGHLPHLRKLVPGARTMFLDQ